MKYIVTSAILFCFANSAWAAGYQLRYQGAESMGTSFASAGSYGNSISNAYYNPGLFLSQKNDRAAALELMVLNPTEAQFTSSTGGASEDDYASASLSGGLFFGYKLDEKTAITVGLTTPWATATDYDSDWQGRYHALETELITLNLQPMFTKQVSDKWILSVGPQIQSMSGVLSTASFTGLPTDLVNEFEGDDIALGGVLAVTYKPSDKTTVGFNYTSRIKHTLEGDLKFSPPALAAGTPPGSGGPLVNSNDASTEITTPDFFTLSVSHVLSEKMIGHVSYSYTNWSLFDELRLVGNGAAAGGAAPVTSVVPQNWEDTYIASVGATHFLKDNFTFRWGVSYETGAVNNADRTPRTQDTDRLGLGVGATFKVASKLRLDIGLNHILYIDDIEIDIASLPADPGPPAFAGRPGVSGSYDFQATLLRAGLEYSF